MSGINPYGSLFLNIMGQGGALSQTGQIISTTQDLKALAVSTILKGEVTQRTQNGNNIIRTDRGDVTVRFNNPLPVGAKVEIQMPPSNAVKQELSVRPSLAQSVSQNATESIPQTVQNNVNAQAAAQVKQPNIFEEVQTLQGTKQTAALKTSEGTNLPQLPLQVGQSVRLTPLPTTQQSIQALIRYFIPLPAPAQISTAMLSPQIQPQAPLQLLPMLGQQTTPTQPVTTASQSIPPFPLATILSTSLAQTTPIITGGQGGIPQTLTILPPQTQSFYPQGQLPPLPPAPTMIRGDTAPTQSITIPASVTTQPPTVTLGGDAQVYRITVAPPTLTQGGQLPTTTPSPAPTVTITPQAGAYVTPAPQTTVQSPAFAGQISATVTGFTTTEGNPIIQIASPTPTLTPQYVVMNYPARELPTGTQITLTPVNSGQSARPAIPTQNAQMPWPAMHEFLEQTLATPALAQHILNTLPSATQPRQFPAAALLFLAAAKNGDLSGWLGQRPMRTIDSSQNSTAQKMLRTLMADLSSMIGKTATQTDPPLVQQSPEWRGYILPLLGGAHPDQATLWVKDDGQNNGDQNQDKKKSLRFLVDLDLTRMGSVQFDGLINTDKKQFDLTLLTERPFGEGTQGEIKGIWLKTLDGLGLSGNIKFKEVS